MSEIPEVNKKLRIMISSNAMWSPSGYAQQVRQFLPKIRQEGYETAIINFYGQEGGIFQLDGIYQYPKIADQWGSDAMVEHAKHFKADVMFTLQDIWVVDPNALKALMQNGVRWVPIIPIDHEPVPPGVYDRLKAAYRIVTYAPFGHRELKRIGLNSTYIPHTVQTDIFKKMDRAGFRKQFGIPDDIFLFGMVAANKDNPPRKSFQHVMDAFYKFQLNHPKSGIYFHTNLRQAGGFDIDQYAKYLGIENKVYNLQPYELLFMIGYEDMAKIYNTFDVLLAPAQNEGFGVPIIEAQSCEVPVITTDFTAMRDLVEDGVTGYKIKVYEKRWTPLGSYVATPDGQDLYEKMEQIFKDDRAKMGRNGRKFVVENFDLNTVFETKWKPFLEKLENEVYPIDKAS